MQIRRKKFVVDPKFADKIILDAAELSHLELKKFLRNGIEI